MAIEDTGDSDDEGGSRVAAEFDSPVCVGEYSWSDFKREEGLRDGYDRNEYLGFSPRDTPRKMTGGASGAKTLQEIFDRYLDPSRRRVAKGEYTWEHFKQEYYYTETGDPPYESGEKVPFRR